MNHYGVNGLATKLMWATWWLLKWYTPWNRLFHRGIVLKVPISLIILQLFNDPIKIFSKNVFRLIFFFFLQHSHIPTQLQIFTYRIESDWNSFELNLLIFLIQCTYFGCTLLIQFGLFFCCCCPKYLNRNYPKHVIQIEKKKNSKDLSAYQL